MCGCVYIEIFDEKTTAGGRRRRRQAAIHIINIFKNTHIFLRTVYSSK